MKGNQTCKWAHFSEAQTCKWRGLNPLFLNLPARPTGVLLTPSSSAVPLSDTHRHKYQALPWRWRFCVEANAIVTNVSPCPLMMIKKWLISSVCVWICCVHFARMCFVTTVYVKLCHTVIEITVFVIESSLQTMAFSFLGWNSHVKLKKIWVSFMNKRSTVEKLILGFPIIRRLVVLGNYCLFLGTSTRHNLTRCII